MKDSVYLQTIKKVILDKLVSSRMFKVEYLKDIPIHFQWQLTPIQIYPLSFLRHHLKLPLPTIQTNYNFLFFIKEGTFIDRIDNEIHTCEADSIVFISNSTVSALQSTSENLKGYFILIEEETMSVLFNQQDLLNVFMINPVLKLNEKDSAWTYSLCRLLYSELNTENPSTKTSESLTQALLNKVLYLSEKKRSISRTHQIAIHFKQLVYQHFIAEKRIAFYADYLAVSGNYLNRCVKKVFDKSCKEIIMEIAILKSQILLVEQHKSIAEISFALNFEDPSYFTRLFKNFTGCTPSEYRMKVMQDLS